MAGAIFDGLEGAGHCAWRRLTSAAAALLLSCGICAAATAANVANHAPTALAGPCPRPAPGSEVAEPVDLRSVDGVLEVELAFRSERMPGGSTRYCYVMPDGTQAPTLRLHPGDLLVLRLRNELQGSAAAALPAGAAPALETNLAGNAAMQGHHGHDAAAPTDPCLAGIMNAGATNLHFHGLTLPPRCHQDEVLRTSIASGAPPFEYRLRIAPDEPPGLYWYHPHIHGFSSRQVSGGASGALVVEGIERADAELAGLPERVLVIRDQDLLNPDAPPSKYEPVVPRNLVDRDGDAGNNGTGFGKPAKDLSVNFVPVPYPDYPRATMRMRPGERQLWRVLNASSVTYLNLAWLFGRTPQRIGIVAVDGVPFALPGLPGARAVAPSRGADGGSNPATQWVTHVGVPPGARVEFIVTAPPAGATGLLVTRSVDTGQGGENDPNRALVAVAVQDDAPAPRSTLAAAGEPLAPSKQPWLASVAPKRVRTLFFSERQSDPADPNSPMLFFITETGKNPQVFDPQAPPAIEVHQGDVEDWIVENRTSELHAFHIHQIHFELMDWSGRPVDEPFLRDTVNVPYYNGKDLSYPSVRLRMDFRNPDIVGDFVYHCHLLEHEDGGMMGVIRVLPSGNGGSSPSPAAGDRVSP
jgi:FtsP/CotA-like multicopper oxidase with cupredoxin domain